MLRVWFAALMVALAIPATAAGIAPPANDDEGSAGIACRWNPFAFLVYQAGSYYWVGRFEWFDPPGHPTGIPCA